MRPLEFGTPVFAEIDPLGSILAQAFGFPPDDARPWLERAGFENVRVVRDASGVVGGLLFYPMGQFFGGRSVPMAGIAGVGTDPAAQGAGTATWMMRAAVSELAGSGFALSCLYPATQPIYRRAGYEQAGLRCRIEARTEHLALGDRFLSLRRAGPTDLGAIRALQRRIAGGHAGALDRSELLWRRITEPLIGAKPSGYVVERSGELEGYCFAAKRGSPGDRQELVVSDLAAATPQAATRLLTFLGDHRSLIERTIWHGGPADPLLLLVREQRYVLTVEEAWMLRILDVERALEARGFPPGLSARLEFEVFDEVLAGNRGNWILEIHGGEGRVSRGGGGAIKAHVRGLAPLYSGHLSAQALALTGLVEGDAAALQLATAIFAGPQPAMSDFF
ncbi:MAG TPA: GNAT family N-acetyltransferase [Vulgatibacter sp.]